MKGVINTGSRDIYIVRSPEEAAGLKKAKLGSSESDDFEWQLQGSPEHVETLQRAYDQHARRADALRKSDIRNFDEYDSVRTEMSELSEELKRVKASNTDLRNNFDEYGYRERIKGLNDGSDDKDSTTMKLYTKPTLRQYFHDGVLYRTRRPEEIMSFELFVDLLYVGIIAINGDQATEDPTGERLLQFCVTFLPSWRIWTDINTIVSYFNTGDILQRYVILLILALLVGYAVNVESAFQTSYRELITYYLLARLVVAGVLTRMAITLPHIRPFLYFTILTMVMPGSLWIGSIFVNDGSSKETLIWLANLADNLGGPVALMLIRSSALFPESIAARMRRIFNYYPAINIEHAVERIGSFVSLVFGYSVVGLLFQNRDPSFPTGFLGKAVLGLSQAYYFNMIYFDIDAKHLQMHALRRHAISGALWMIIHLPFIVCFTIAGSSLAKLVFASDGTNMNPENLADDSREKSLGDDVPEGLRWYYCCGLGGALFTMAVIAATHIHRPVQAQRIRKPYRLAVRCVVAIVMSFLPLAKSLTSLGLIAITSSLTLVTLAFDIYGMSSSDESFIGGEEHASESSEQPADGNKTGEDGLADTPLESGVYPKPMDRPAAPAASRKVTAFMG